MRIDKTVLYLYFYIVSFVCVIHILKRDPDDDSGRGSKHVGVAYRDCDIQFLKK
jgi:hypothetical protein